MISIESHLTDIDRAIAAEQIKAFFKEANGQNVVGTMVLSLTVWVMHELVPTWSWFPGLSMFCVAAFYRSYLMWQHRRNPLAKTPAEWGFWYTFGTAIAGLGWGFACTVMSVYATLPYQLFIFTVAVIVAPSAVSESFAYTTPSRAIIATSLTPLIFLYLTGHENLLRILGVMLCIYLPMLIWQGARRHSAYLDSLKLRFKYEFLSQALAEQRKIAEDAGQTKARFLAAASHDLRQPAQALVIFQELIKPEMQLTSRGETYFTRAQQAVKAISSLLDSLLDISKLDSNTVQPQHQPVLIAHLLDEMQTEFNPLAEQKGIRLRIVRSSACLNTDPLLLGQILRNLISNALRYTVSGKVLIGCRHRHDRFVIEVWDTGIGIREDQQQAIFGEFFQVGNRERDRQQGLGLGLAIVHRLAKLLGATVTVRSRLGKGSCFAVSLPLRIERAAPAAHDFRESVTPFAATPYDLSGRLIVFVENEETIRNGIHALLVDWGCDVISGPSRDSVLEQIKNHGGVVDVVITDFGLPEDENGIDVIRKLRSRVGSKLSALLISGDTSQSTLEGASKEGLTILHKPLQPRQLREALYSLIQAGSESHSASGYGN